MFTRTSQYQFSIPKELLRYRLLGHRVKIHNLDFEVTEEQQHLCIAPKTEEVRPIKTPPVARVEFEENGNKTNVRVTMSMRKLDAGGPLLILSFCSFLIVTSVVLLYVGKDPVLTWSLFGASIAILLTFAVVVQLGYFQYVRKLKAFIQLKGDQITRDVRRQVFKHKVA